MLTYQTNTTYTNTCLGCCSSMLLMSSPGKEAIINVKKDELLLKPEAALQA